MERLMIVLESVVKSEYISMVASDCLKGNRIWGVEYLLMDSGSLGGDGGCGYENIIKILTELWGKCGEAAF